MNRAALLAASALLVGGAIWASRARASIASSGGAGSSGLSFIGEDVMHAISGWSPPERAAPYLDAIATAERRYGLPQNLLARLLYQESRFREDIITGQLASPAGALGIAQFMPATADEAGINPLDPFQAIPAAARYLRQLYDRFGTWGGALAAYNWGQGNLARKGIERAPAETREYVSSIMEDVGLA